MANPEHIEWLLEGVEAWNKRREQKKIRPDFKGVDISSEFRKRGKSKENTQSDLRFGNARVFDPDFRVTGADLTDANLTNANLINANLTNAQLRNAVLTRAKLQNAVLARADLTYADLITANLFKADLNNANLTDAQLRNANMINANMTNANLTNANLTNANLIEADLTNADLTNADLISADLTNTNLLGSILIGTDLSFSEPWKAKLYNIFFPQVETGQGTADKMPEEEKEIKSIECLLEECRTEAVS